MVTGSIALFIVVVAYVSGIDNRREDQLIKEWYNRGPYRAIWTKDGIKVQNVESGVFDRHLSLKVLYGTDEREAKIIAAENNRHHAQSMREQKLFDEKAGEIVQ
jgi:hypothetical protein